jgi:hypothetical protein
VITGRGPQEKKGCHGSGREGDVDQNYHFSKENKEEKGTLFTICLLLKEFFV